MVPRLLKNLERLQPPSLKTLAGQLSSLTEGRLWLQVLIGMLLGLATGFALGPTLGWVPADVGAVTGSWLALPGQLFIAAIQMIVIPLVVASIILGVASGENAAQLKRLGLAVTGYFLVTTAAAAAIGLWLASLMAPGRSLSAKLDIAIPAESTVEVMTVPGLADLPQSLIRLLPGNPLSSMVEGQMLQVVLFSIIVGIALVTMPTSQSRPMLELLGSLQQVCMTVVRWAMHVAPIAVFGLMARLTSQLGLDALLGMAHYVVTVLLGLVILLGGYLALVATVGRRSPLRFLAESRELLLLAFSTSSSAAVMPLSIKTAEERLGVRPSVAQFVVPLGATVNMNGTALYQGVATVFLAQVYGIDLGLGGMMLVVALAVGASVGSPATPGVGIVILATVLATVGIPPEGVALIIGVDRILDMSRTAINVAGDLTACQIMDRWVGHSKPENNADALQESV